MNKKFKKENFLPRLAVFAAGVVIIFMYIDKKGLEYVASWLAVAIIILLWLYFVITGIDKWID